MESVLCDRCGAEYGIGDWPLCGGDPKKHESTRPYHPFIPFYDYQLGGYVGGLADWNRLMKKTGFELADHKHDHEPSPPKPSVPGFDQAFNRSVREIYGGVLPTGNFLRDE